MARLRPLVDEVLPEVRRRLDKSLATVPEVEAPTQVLGVSVALGAVSECLGMARDRLRDAVLEHVARVNAQSSPRQPCESATTQERGCSVAVCVRFVLDLADRARLKRRR